MSSLPEIDQIERRIDELGSKVRSEIIERVTTAQGELPIYKLSFGSLEPSAPTLGIVGGVHGLERIGAQVAVSLLESFSELTLWDRGTQAILEQVRVFFIPVLNPSGVMHETRSNFNGVDLMRNAPVEGEGKLPFLLSGQRYSPRLPWYRGSPDRLEPESQALIKAVQAEGFRSRCLITLDIHSGFGFQDQIWFPYAKTQKPFPNLAELHSFKNLLERTYPHHFYRVEPQAYSTHGDLWDYLYDMHQQKQASGIYLPLCLEMGSWMWVKKNPWQIFSPLGPFNPLKQHRHRRTLRRHNTLFEFLLRSIQVPEVWGELSLEQRQKHQSQAQELWYDRKR